MNGIRALKIRRLFSGRSLISIAYAGANRGLFLFAQTPRASSHARHPVLGDTARGALGPATVGAKWCDLALVGARKLKRLPEASAARPCPPATIPLHNDSLSPPEASSSSSRPGLSPPWFS